MSRSHKSAEETTREPYAVFCGVDVGKAEHHACALDVSGRRLHDKALPNDEASITGVLSRLAERGKVLVVVDQPASIGALTIAVARSLSIDVGYLPGLAMRRLADVFPGEGKTDARDAYVIAETARTMPHVLRRVGADEQTLAELSVLAGYDDDLAGQSTRLTNRLHDALLHIHPALERVVGQHLDRPGVLALLTAAPTPAALASLGVDGIAAALREGGSPRLARSLPAKIRTALDAHGHLRAHATCSGARGRSPADPGSNTAFPFTVSPGHLPWTDGRLRAGPPRDAGSVAELATGAPRPQPRRLVGALANSDREAASELRGGGRGGLVLRLDRQPGAQAGRRTLDDRDDAPTSHRSVEPGEQGACGAPDR